MNEERTEEAVLRYLQENRGLHSLTTLFERVMEPSVPDADAYDLDDEIESKEELRVLLDDMAQEGLLRAHWGERDYESSYRITDEGGYRASGFNQYVVETANEQGRSVDGSDAPASPATAIVTDAGQPLVTETGDFIIAEGPKESVGEASSAAPISIASETWTGLKAVRIDAKNAKVVSKLIGNALDRLSDSEAGNEAVMQAAAYLKAARELVDAPDPPSVVIWDLLEKAAVVAGLIQLFGMIFSQAAS